MSVFLPRHPALFIHIPKTGGTSIENVMVASGGQLLLGRLPAHRLPREYRAELGAELFDKCYRFTFVRNPWDRVVSAWVFGKWRRLYPICNMDFPDYLDYYLSAYGARQDEFLADCQFHFVGRFENLKDDWRTPAWVLNLPLSLPHLNQNDDFGERPHFSSYYTPGMAQAVRDAEPHTIARFGYTFT